MLTKEQFQDLLQNGPLILDGATGSNLRNAGMPKGCCTEAWILENPEPLVALQRAYAEAGSQDKAEFTLRQAYQIQASVGKCMTKEGHSLLLRLLQEKGDETAYLSVKNGEKLE